MSDTLYLLGRCPHTQSDRFPILETARAGDTLLLHQDGVLGLHPSFPLLDELRSRGVRVIACEPDCRARGVPAPEGAVDWAGFLRLITECARVVS